jgi:hypothetical protein
MTYKVLGFRSFDTLVSALPPSVNAILYRCNASSRIESGLMTSMKLITIPLLKRWQQGTLEDFVSKRREFFY